MKNKKYVRSRGNCITMSALDASPSSAKAKRRKSLAQAMHLVDSAIANLEGIASPGPGQSPAAAYRRRRSSITGGTGNPLLAGAAEVADAKSLVARLSRSCVSEGGAASVSAAEVEILLKALSPDGAATFDPAPLAASLGRSPAAVANLRSWDFDVFEVTPLFCGFEL